jgi:biopolymer transport protein ExbD
MEFRNMTASAYRISLFSQRSASIAQGVMCDMNITPLIDVMLVLLVTLIISLPIMTHAVKLDHFDGTVMWNGSVVENLQQLGSYLHAEAQKEPQPEIHLRPDRHAKYDYVAQVLASAQRNRMTRVGLVNTAEFKD